MNDFDIKSAGWDLNPVHIERSTAVTEGIRSTIPLRDTMRALEFGAGTGIASFLLRNDLEEIIMVDTSEGMVRVMNEKIMSTGSSNLKALQFDLENEEWKDGKFDLILTQMVLHHIIDTKGILAKFRSLLNPGGYLAIADVYSEDGSFHGEGFTGHNGFDTAQMAADLTEAGFSDITEKKCFRMKKQLDDDVTRFYDIFLMTAKLR